MDELEQPDRPVTRITRVRRVRVVPVAPQYNGAILRQPTWRLLLWWALGNTIGAVVGALIANTVTGDFFNSSVTIGELRLFSAAVSGVILGSVIGIVEWLMLQSYIRISRAWVLATGVGWAAAFTANALLNGTIGMLPSAMIAIVAGAGIGIPQSLVLWSQSRIRWPGAWAVGCVVAWLVMIAGVEPISQLASSYEGIQVYIWPNQSPISVELLLELIWFFGALEVITGVMLVVLLRLSAGRKQARAAIRPIAIVRIIVAVVAGVLIIGTIAYQAIYAAEHPPRVNIERSQYEEALAKWQGQKIKEYEITTDTEAFLGGTLTVHVADYGNKVEELAPNVRLLSTLTDDDMKYLKRDTVEGMFAEIDSILSDDEVFKSGAMTVSGGFYMAYQISFDPNLGYPTRIIARPITDPGSYVSDADWDETVTSLKIIKQDN